MKLNNRFVPIFVILGIAWIPRGLAATAASPSARVVPVIVEVEAVDPKQTCERFLTEASKNKCLELLKAGPTDSYLAAVCEKQEDDEQFMKCLKLASANDLDPRKIQPCRAEMEDVDRLSCLSLASSTDRKTAAVKSKTAGNKDNSARLPASQRKKTFAHPRGEVSRRNENMR